MIRRALPSLAALLLPGCASPGADRIPSLAPRAAERHGFEEPATPAPAAARADPALDARIAEVTGAAADHATAFAAARAAAEAKVAAAAGAAAGSEGWLDAQVALGTLDVQRAGAGETVTALEQLAADRAVVGEAPYPALEEALATARADLAGSVAVVAALNARLRR